MVLAADREINFEWRVATIFLAFAMGGVFNSCVEKLVEIAGRTAIFARRYSVSYSLHHAGAINFED